MCFTPFIAVNFVSLLLLQFLPKCKGSYCLCRQNICIPIIKQTVLDPENPSEILEWPLSDNIQIEDDEDKPISLQVMNDQPQNNKQLNNFPVPT